VGAALFAAFPTRFFGQWNGATSDDIVVPGHHAIAKGRRSYPVGDTFTFMVRGRQDRGGMGAHSLLMGTRNRRRAGGRIRGP
jgi:hypothetical protein